MRYRNTLTYSLLQLVILDVSGNAVKLTGTKLACNAGGCGSCTVLVSKFHHSTDTIMYVCHFSSFSCLLLLELPSVLWRCWLSGRKCIRAVKRCVCVCLCVCVLLHSLKTFFYTLSHTGIKNKNAVGRVFISLVYSVLRLRFIVFGYLTSVQCSWILDFCIDILYFSCLCSLYLCAAFIWRNKE